VSVTIETRGFDDLRKALRAMDADADRASVLAVNTAARDGRAMASRQMRDEVRFPRSYLNGERLSISKRATQGDPEAVIRGRDRPTSLARFAVGQVRFGRQRGVKVRVSARGGGMNMRAGFFIRLRNSNVGLAVRLRKGESLYGSTAAKKLDDGLYLLYGPSVDQVFQGVAVDIVDAVGDKAASEFIRQFERLQNGR
jgi:hypothetical protein